MDPFYNRGWRPFAGWLASIGLGVVSIAYPVALIARGEPIDLIALGSVLGYGGWLAGLRTYEKRKGV